VANCNFIRNVANCCNILELYTDIRYFIPALVPEYKRQCHGMTSTTPEVINV